MSLRGLSVWALLLAVGCDGKLVVDRGGNSVSGASGDSASGASGDSASGDSASGASGDSASGASGASGAGTVIAPDAGKIGEPCLPEGLVTEAEGYATEAVIKVLARCEPGLSCNAQGKCAAAPDCQQSRGVCVMRRSTFNQVIYDSLHAQTGVFALAASDSHVYWLEY